MLTSELKQQMNARRDERRAYRERFRRSVATNNHTCEQIARIRRDKRPVTIIAYDYQVAWSVIHSIKLIR